MNDLRIVFSNKQEVRMGSPYLTANLSLEGIDMEIPKADWQDKYAISKDKKFIVLIGFDFMKNEPGFKFYIIDVINKKVTKTNRIKGLVNNVSILNRNIKYNKFLYEKTKSKNGELCCNLSEEFEIK